MKNNQYSTSDVPGAESSDDWKTKFLDKIIKLYNSKLHIIMIIVELVVSCVELGHGIRYNNQCPIQQMIGPFLITHGAVTVLFAFMIILAMIDARVVYVRGDKRKARLAMFIIFFIIVLLNIFFFAWFIAGNVWVFGAKTNGVQGTDSTLSTYCQPDLYRAAFVLIIVRYIIIPIIIIIGMIVWFCKSQ